jgi:hypothetical protein
LSLPGKSSLHPGVIEESSFLGSDTFVERPEHKMEKGKSLSEIPKSQKRAQPKTLKQYEIQTNMRDDAIRNSYASGGQYEGDRGILRFTLFMD